MGHDLSHLTKRKDHSLGALKNSNPIKTTFLLAADDAGVIRNGGRRGSSLGPEAILHQLSKLSQGKESRPYDLMNLNFGESFEENQSKNIDEISAHLIKTKAKNIINLGGGHDHIYPFAMALKGPLYILNLDAHLDTRHEALPHSGTPFRQIYNEKTDLKIKQVGIHSYANPQGNFDQIQMEVLTVAQAHAFLGKEEDLLANIPSGYQLVLSLDADAICSSIMEAVSAPNHNGLKAEFINNLFLAYLNYKQEKKYIGIYEYNPLYDNLNAKGARYLASLLYPFI